MGKRLSKLVTVCWVRRDYQFEGEVEVLVELVDELVVQVEFAAVGLRDEAVGESGGQLQTLRGDRAEVEAVRAELLVELEVEAFGDEDLPEGEAGDQVLEADGDFVADSFVVPLGDLEDEVRGVGQLVDQQQLQRRAQDDDVLRGVVVQLGQAHAVPGVELEGQRAVLVVAERGVVVETRVAAERDRRVPARVVGHEVEHEGEVHLELLRVDQLERLAVVVDDLDHAVAQQHLLRELRVRAVQVFELLLEALEDLEAFGAVGVVDGLRGRVREHLEDLLELAEGVVRGLQLAGLSVGVDRFGELFVVQLDLFVGGAPRQPEQVVVHSQ